MARHEANGLLMQKDFSKDPVYRMLHERYQELARSEAAPDVMAELLKTSEIEFNAKREHYRSKFRSGERKRKTSAAVIGLALGTLGLHSQLFGRDVLDDAGRVTKHIAGVLDDTSLHPTNPVLRAALKVIMWGQEVPEYPETTSSQAIGITPDTLASKIGVTTGETGGNVSQEVTTNITVDGVIKVEKGQTLWSIFQDQIKDTDGFKNLTQEQQNDVLSKMIQNTQDHASDYGLTDVNKLQIGQELPIQKMIEENSVSDLIKNAGKKVFKSVKKVAERSPLTEAITKKKIEMDKLYIEQIKETVKFAKIFSNDKFAAIYNAMTRIEEPLDQNDPGIFRIAGNAVEFIERVEGFPDPKNNILLRYLIEIAHDNDKLEIITDRAEGMGLSASYVQEIVTSLDLDNLSNFEWSQAISEKELATTMEQVRILVDDVSVDIDPDKARNIVRGAVAKAYDVYAACAHDISNFDAWVSKKGASLLEQEQFRDAMMKKLKSATEMTNKLFGDNVEITRKLNSLQQIMHEEFNTKKIKFTEHLKDLAGTHGISFEKFIENINDNKNSNGLNLGEIAGMVKEQADAATAMQSDQLNKSLPYKQNFINFFKVEILDKLPEGSNLATNTALRGMNAMQFLKSIYK